LAEVLGTRVRRAAEVEGLLGARTLAALPLEGPRRPVAVLREERPDLEARYGLIAGAIEAQMGQRECIVVGVTSSIPSEGKSTTAASLAVVLARQGVRVGLVDLDLRRPACAKALGVRPPGTGMSGASAEDHRGTGVDAGIRVTVGQAERGRSRRGEEGHVAAADQGIAELALYVGCGSPGERPEGVLRDEALPGWIEGIRELFDFVILDLPPALVARDVLDVAGVVDGLLVVVRPGWVERRELAALARQAEIWRSPVIGAVLVGGPTAEARAYRYYGGR